MEIYDLEIEKGNTEDLKLLFKSNGIGIDITDYTVYFTAKRSLSDIDASAVINKSITSHSSATTGETLIELSSSDTDITVGSYYYSIDVKDDDSDIRNLFRGTLLISNPVRITK